MVPLTTFSLDGSSRRGLRRTIRRLERANATFEIVPREAVPGLLPELERVSNEWLESKRTREKGFSAPLWQRVGALVYGHGERFYNFRGVRNFKEKFDPVWTPRYIVSPGGLALPRILTSIAALISDGWRGVVSK